MKDRRTGIAFSVAVVALLVMAAGARMVPDSRERAAVLPLGMATLAVVSACSAAALVWMLLDLGARPRSVALLLLGFGWVLVLPGADAEGAALVVAGCYARPWRWCAPLVHVATLGPVLALALGGRRRELLGSGLAVAAVAVVLDAARGAGGPLEVFDLRYLLPACAMLCVPAERRQPGVRALLPGRGGDGPTLSRHTNKEGTMRKRISLMIVGASLVALAVAGVASAASTPPSAPDFTDAVNTYGTSLANGLMPILTVVLGVAAVFTLYKVGVHAIKRWIGRSNASSAVS